MNNSKRSKRRRKKNSSIHQILILIIIYPSSFLQYYDNKIQETKEETMTGTKDSRIITENDDWFLTYHQRHHNRVSQVF